MGRADLRLIRGRDGRPPGGDLVVVSAIVVAIAGCFVLATLRGADAARRKFDARAEAQQALERALEDGNDAPDVLASRRRLRDAVRERPLDAGRRVAYAAVLLGLARSMDDVEAATFHADLAARLAPVTVPVVRSAALVLIRGTRRERAVELARAMFDYDADAAADLLVHLEPFLTTDELTAARPASPGASLAWAQRLRDDGRGEEGAAVVAAAQREWPDHAGLVRQRAVALTRARDWSRLAELLPIDGPLPPSHEQPELLAYRARWRCAGNDRDGGTADAETAAATAGGPWQRLAAGDALAACGRDAAARRAWSHALHRSRDEPASLRVDLRVRLARAEERDGDLVAALGHWRAAVALAPDHAEATNAIGRLTNPR